MNLENENDMPILPRSCNRDILFWGLEKKVQVLYWHRWTKASLVYDVFMSFFVQLTVLMIKEFATGW